MEHEVYLEREAGTMSLEGRMGGMSLALTFDRELTLAAGYDATLQVLKTKPGRIADHLRAGFLIISGFNKAEAEINVNHIMAEYHLSEGISRSIREASKRTDTFLTSIEQRYPS